MISSGFKQEAGRTNLRIKEKTNGLVEAKTGGKLGQPSERRENK